MLQVHISYHEFLIWSICFFYHAAMTTRAFPPTSVFSKKEIKSSANAWFSVFWTGELSTAF